MSIFIICSGVKLKPSRHDASGNGDEGEKLERSDIFIPQSRILTNKIPHQLFTLCQVQILNSHGVRLHELAGSRKCFCFAGDHPLNTKLYNCTNAQITRHQRRIKYDVSVPTDSPCISKTVYLSMQYRVSLLNSLVTAVPPQNLVHAN